GRSRGLADPPRPGATDRDGAGPANVRLVDDDEGGRPAGAARDAGPPAAYRPPWARAASLGARPDLEGGGTRGARHRPRPHPRGLAEGDRVDVRSRVGQVEATLRVSEDMRPGVVSLPHGWGHHRPGTRLRVAALRPGASLNDLTDEAEVDALCGTAVLSGVPV